MVGQQLGIFIRSGTSLNLLRTEPQVHTGQKPHAYLISFNIGGYDGLQVGMKQALSI